MKLGLNDLEDRVLLVRKENYMNRCKTTVCLSISQFSTEKDMKLGLNDLEDRVLLVSTEIGMNRFKTLFVINFVIFDRKT